MTKENIIKKNVRGKEMYILNQKKLTTHLFIKKMKNRRNKKK